MSTRATYQIFDDTFYIHHDGYLEGAAGYFYNMVKASRAISKRGIWDNYRPKGGLDLAFIRGNTNCERTDSHEAHADTEYRYDVFEVEKKLMVKALERQGWDSVRWVTVFNGLLCDFVNIHCNAKYNFVESATELAGIVTVKGQYMDYICTVEQALEVAQGYLEGSNKFSLDNINHSNYLLSAKAITKAVDYYMQRHQNGAMEAAQ